MWTRSRARAIAIPAHSVPWMQPKTRTGVPCGLPVERDNRAAALGAAEQDAERLGTLRSGRFAGWNENQHDQQRREQTAHEPHTAKQAPRLFDLPRRQRTRGALVTTNCDL